MPTADQIETTPDTEHRRATPTRSRIAAGIAVLALSAVGVLTAPAAQAAPAAPTPAASTSPSADKAAVQAQQARQAVAGRAASGLPGGKLVMPADADILFLQNPDGRLEEFWRGSDCALWHSWQLTPGGAWSANASLGGCLTSGVDGESNADGRLEVFVRGTTNQIYHIWQGPFAGGWSGWASLGGVLVSGPYTSRTSYNGIIVDALGPDGIWHRRYQTAANCCWSDWVFGVAH
jgi:hypothetical protein